MKKLLPILLAAFTTLPAAAAAPAAGDIILSQSNGSGPSTIRVIPATAGTLPTGALMHSGSNVFASGTLPLTMGGTGQTSASTATQSFLNTISTNQGSVLYRGASSWVALSPGSAGQVLTTGGASANPSWSTVSGTGTVTSVGASGPTGIFTWSSAITASGTLTATLASQSANTVFAGPTSGAAATPTFRSLVAADLPDLSGVYQVADGVFNVTAYGAVPDARKITDASTTSGSGTVTCASAPFTSADNGKVAWVVNGTTKVNTVPIGTVTYVSPTQITISNNATATASNQNLVIGTNSQNAFDDAEAAALAAGKGTIYIPAGGYITTARILDGTLGTNAVNIAGADQQNTILYMAPSFTDAGSGGDVIDDAVSVRDLAIDGCNYDFSTGGARGANRVISNCALGVNVTVEVYGYATLFHNSIVASYFNCRAAYGSNYGFFSLNRIFIHGGYSGNHQGVSVQLYDLADSFASIEGMIIDESTTNALSLQNSRDVMVSGCVIYGGSNNYGAILRSSSNARFVNCVIERYNTNTNSGGLDVGTGCTAYLADCRLEGQGTRYSISTQVAATGTIVDLGGNTLDSAINGSWTDGALAVRTVATGGTGVATMTGIPYGSGTSAFSAVTIGTGLTFSGGTLSRDALTGDITTSGNAATLATVNSNVGSFTNASITVNAKGLITAASNGSGGITINSTTSNGTAGNVLYTDGSKVQEYSVVPVSEGGTNASSAGITAFNNITGYSAAGATGTTSTNLVFSTSPTLVTPAITTSATVTNNSLGTSTAIGTLITNTTAAAAGAQQVSPATRWTGQGWKTNATAASQPCDFQSYVLPVQGSANPTAKWCLQKSINSESFVELMNVLATAGSSEVTFSLGASGGVTWSLQTVSGLYALYNTGSGGHYFTGGGVGDLYIDYNRVTLGASHSFGWVASGAASGAQDAGFYRVTTRTVGLRDPNSTSASTLRIYGDGSTATKYLTLAHDGTNGVVSASSGILDLDTKTAIKGTATNDDAAAGDYGEIITSAVASGSAVSLTTATAADITSISLTAGDWDVSGNVNIAGSSATYTQGSGGISSTSATLPTDGTEVNSSAQITLASVTDGVTCPRKRFSISGTTTVYLVGKATFSAGTMSCYGSITARRVR